MEPVKKSLISLHIAVILLGGTGLFSHIIPLSATDITLGRSLFACIALFCVVLIGKEGLALGRRRDYGIAIGLGGVIERKSVVSGERGVVAWG